VTTCRSSGQNSSLQLLPSSPYGCGFAYLQNVGNNSGVVLDHLEIVSCTASCAQASEKLDQARRLKELEKENSRLKRVVAELSLEKQILKDVAEGNF
jgi:hypothetical protein